MQANSSPDSLPQAMRNAIIYTTAAHENRYNCAIPHASELDSALCHALSSAMPDKGADRKCQRCGAPIYQGVLCANCHSPEQPPCDDDHVAPGCALFSDPTKTKPFPSPSAPAAAWAKEAADEISELNRDAFNHGNYYASRANILSIILKHHANPSKE